MGRHRVTPTLRVPLFSHQSISVCIEAQRMQRVCACDPHGSLPARGGQHAGDRAAPFQAPSRPPGPRPRSWVHSASPPRWVLSGVRDGRCLSVRTAQGPAACVCSGHLLTDLWVIPTSGLFQSPAVNAPGRDFRLGHTGGWLLST